MGATLIGTTGAWGIASDETGVIVSALDFDFVNKEKATLTRQGETQGFVFYDEMVNISLKGEVPTATPFSGTLTGTLTLANAVPNHLKGGVTGGSVIIKSGLKRSLAYEDFQKIEIPAQYVPLIAAV